ncbi:MAG: fluoride efflux transporter CrcB [Tildeniella torsiva UHER 1998/13D]|nr:fluoride efflux transporter CrcB [Tildeniella torsiva UHER 1998/13D]
MVSPGLRAPIAVALGAIPGALSRYYLGKGLATMAGMPDFPIGTLGVNLLGCFLLGLFLTLTLKKWPVSPEFRLMVVTGFIGSFTTFSSYELDVAHLTAMRQGWLAGIYWVGSPLLGLLCLWSGIALGRKSHPEGQSGN